MKSRWKIEYLGNHVSQQNTHNNSLNNIPVYSVTNSEGFKKSTDYFSKEVFSKDLSNYKIVKRNQFAYNPSRINVGSIACLSDMNFVLVSPLYIVFEVNREKLFPDYLLRFLKSNYGNIQIRNNTQGSVRDSLKFEGLSKIQVPIPSVIDQIRIATILTRSERLIAKRKESIKMLDELLKSVFLEMFGDPVRNEKGWDMYKSIDYSEKTTVGVVIKPASYYKEKGVIALRSLNIKPNKIDLNNLTYFSEESSNGILSKSILKQGDVVIVRTGMTGTAAVIPKDLEGTNCIDLIIVRPRRNILNPIYLVFLFNSERGKRLVTSKEVGGIQKHFNIGAITNILFPIPPLSLQKKFATIVEKVESLKAKYMQSLTELENLYNSLSQRAFKGELDLSRIPIEKED